MRKLIVVLGVLLIVLGAGTVHAQDDPVVHTVLFYSPTCPHCHIVIDEVLPPLQEQYGDQLKIMFVDVSQPAGADLFRSACTAIEIPDCGGVPTLIISDVYLVGSGDIPRYLPSLIEYGLQNDGIPLPAVPGLAEAYQSASTGNDAIQINETEEASVMDKFNEDPVANGLAVVVLLGLIASIGAVFVLDKKSKFNFNGVVLLLAGVALFLGASLLIQSDELSGASILAVLITGGLLYVLAQIWQAQDKKPLSEWIIPIVAIIGLLVAGYLAYVEMSEESAVCGAVGDCNTVQQSDYAKLFGVLPIGVLGVIGYLAILGAWYFSRKSDLGQVVLFNLTLFGIAFSIYLTYLEPFVIGATCAWCLTSAVLMLLLLWLQAPKGWRLLPKNW